MFFLVSNHCSKGNKIPSAQYNKTAPDRYFEQKKKYILKFREIIEKDMENVKNRSSSTYLVFEIMDHDFLGLINARFSFTLAQIKYVMLSLLRGVDNLHSKKIQEKIKIS